MLLLALRLLTACDMSRDEWGSETSYSLIFSGSYAVHELSRPDPAVITLVSMGEHPLSRPELWPFFSMVKGLSGTSSFIHYLWYEQCLECRCQGHDLHILLVVGRGDGVGVWVYSDSLLNYAYFAVVWVYTFAGLVARSVCALALLSYRMTKYKQRRVG